MTNRCSKTSKKILYLQKKKWLSNIEFDALLNLYGKILTPPRGIGMDECIFCRIVSGEIPSDGVYETGNVLAFLDIAPVQSGHVVLIPKLHYATLLDLPLVLGEELLRAQKRIAASLMNALGADGVNIGMNINEAAGQLVYHAHFHLIPRYTGDNLDLWKQGKYESSEAMAKVADKIRKYV